MSELTLPIQIISAAILNIIHAIRNIDLKRPIELKESELYEY